MAIGSCHFTDCKVLLVTSLTHVSGAIASTFTFTFTAPRRHDGLNSECNPCILTVIYRKTCGKREESIKFWSGLDRESGSLSYFAHHCRVGYISYSHRQMTDVDKRINRAGGNIRIKPNSESLFVESTKVRYTWRYRCLRAHLLYCLFFCVLWHISQSLESLNELLCITVSYS